MTKNLLFLILFLAFSIGTASAENQGPKKEIVIIDKFTVSGDVSESYVQTIRNNVMSGFVTKGRFSTVDATQDDKIKALNANRGEEGVDVSNVMDETHSALYKSMGAKYIILGDATQYTCTKSTKDGKVSYKTSIYLSLKGFDITTGEAIVAAQMELMGFGNTKSEADASANEDVKGKINGYIDDNFQFETKILEFLDMKKNKVETLYILAGSEVGIKNGDTFLVHQAINVAGIKSKKEIGRVRVIEVAGAIVSLCKVTKGNEEITTEFNKGTELIVESLGRSFLKEGGSIFGL